MQAPEAALVSSRLVQDLPQPGQMRTLGATEGIVASLKAAHAVRHTRQQLEDVPPLLLGQPLQLLLRQVVQDVLRQQRVRARVASYSSSTQDLGAHHGCALWRAECPLLLGCDEAGLVSLVSLRWGSQSAGEPEGGQRN